MTFPKFIVEFNALHREVKKFKLNFDDGILAYFLLAAANLSDDHERLVRATASLNYNAMKDTLQKVFGELDTKDGELKDSTLPVKEEVLFTKGYQHRYRGGGRGSQHQNYQRDSGASGGSQRFQRGRGRGRGRRDGGNPVDTSGTVMRCHECESTRHFVNDCPDRKVEEANLTVHLTLVAGSASKEQEVMLVESLARGILDSACTKTVAGQTWIEEYLSLLSASEREAVLRSAKSSSSLYRFGDGKETRSKQELCIPMMICGEITEIAVDVVDNDIPLLISRPTMTELGMILDTGKHTVQVHGRTYNLEFNSSGHYTIPVSAWTNEDCNVVFHLENLASSTLQEKQRKAVKLHRQFAHASKERLLKLLRNGGCEDKEFLKAVEKCCEDCEFCGKYRRPKPRPVVALPKADKFNQVVAMDLKEVTKGKLWILHIVDSATRYTAAALIHSKKKEVIVGKIFQIWLAYFGSPVKFHSDCGGEFVNAAFMELNEQFGIETSTTPGESPFGNGVVERNNAMLYETMMKTMEDVKCSMETALAWAVCAKNSLQNTFGYSPNQLVFGINVNLPSVEHDAPPALKSPEHSDLVRENLNALHKARENFIKSESSERIKRALRHNVRTYAEVEFSPGEKVYYKRRADKGWKGPAKVLGKETNFVLIRHGASYYRCHPCQLMKISSHEATDKVTTQDKVPVVRKASVQKAVLDDDSSSDDDSSPDDDTSSDEGSDTESCSSPDEESKTEDELVTTNEKSVRKEETATAVKDVGARVMEETSETVKEPRALRTLRPFNKPGLKEDAEKLKDNTIRPASGTTIQYALEDGIVTKAHVLSSQSNQPGTLKDAVNVQIVGKDAPVRVKWNSVKWWRDIEITEQVLTLTSVEECQQDVIDAKEVEMQNLIEHDVFEWVSDDGQKAVSSKWIFHEKKHPDGSRKLKARLVARGFEEKLADKRVDSPTCSRQGIRLAFLTASSMNWELQAMDISSAFLQGNALQRTVYVRPPKEVCEEGKIWRLKRCLYGLSDAPREWYDRVCREMTTLGGIISLYDKSLFMWHVDDQLVGMITTHVDDFEYCGTLVWKAKVIGRLLELFKISKNEKGSFKYIGLNIEQNGDEIFVDQHAYCSSLQEIRLEGGRRKDDPLSEDDKKQLRSVCGQLLWATTQTRPDAAFDACQVSNYGNDATVKSLTEANKAVKKLKADGLRIVYPGLGGVDTMRVVVYADGSHAGLPSGSSQGANIVFVAGNGRSAPISWSSKKLERVTKSPLATEVSAVADAADHGHLVASMLKELYCLDKLPIIELYTDSKSLKEHLETTRVISDPRLRVDIARLREMREIGEVDVKWVRSGLQLADCMTKKGASTDLLRRVLASGALPGHHTNQ